MKPISVLLFIFILLNTHTFAQEKNDSTKSEQLEEVRITKLRIARFHVDSNNIIIDRATIEMMQPDDLGELLKKIPGAQVKSYGGLGGMKTVNIRGLSGHHTALIVDGFQQTNPQTGQSNLANFHLDDIEQVIIQKGGNSEIMVPVKAQLAGNAIILKSFQATAPRMPLQQRLISKFGSWTFLDNQLTLKTGSEKFYGGVLLKYRKSDGDYPFKFMNYNTLLEGERKNNDFMDINGGVNFGYKPYENHKFNFFFDYMTAQQGVPGPIVLYNDNAKQRLNTATMNIRADYQGKAAGIDYRAYYTFIKDDLFYYDPHYLNAQGELKSDYLNHTNDLGISLAYSLKKWFSFNAGSEWTHSNLTSKNAFLSRPVREHLSSFAKSTFSAKKISVTAQIGHQYIQEKNKAGEAATNVSKFSPFLETRYRINRKLALTAYYRNSFRPPSFNELYYNNIGNNKLKPEDAHQFSLSGSYALLDNNTTYLGFQVAAYYHEISNMILSMPTKNTFIWSIQNIGKNKVQGIEAMISFNQNFKKDFSIQTLLNYTFQSSRDFSNPTSPSYKHQIAYSPKHVFNFDFTFMYREIGTRFSTYVCSDRYALNENIPQNIVSQFYTLDWTIFSNFRIDKYNTIKLQLTVKNITNVSYAYIKNYVMPGRQIQFTFVYAFI